MTGWLAGWLTVGRNKMSQCKLSWGMHNWLGRWLRGVAVTRIEGFIGKVVGFMAGQCAEILIAMGAGAGAG